MTFQPGYTSALVRRLADAFKACPIGEKISYAVLSAALGMPIQGRTYLAQRAMKLANQECGAHFVNIRGVGYHRLPGEEASSIGRHARERTRRIYRRANQAITNVLVYTNDISDKARMRAYSEQATLGLLQHMTYDRNMPVVAEGARPPPTQDVVRHTIEALRALRRDGPPA